MRKWIYTFVFLALAAKVSFAQNSVQETLNRFRDSLGEYGIVALVAEGDKITTGAVGYADSGVLLNEDHLMCIGSITKTYTSATIFRLQEMGLLKIDDPISKYLTLYNKNIDAGVTIRHLLDHSSGIGDFGTAELMNEILTRPDKLYTADFCLGKIDTMLFERGMRHSYSNSNYFLLGLIIEQVTQQPLEFAYLDLLLKPNSLDSTYPYFSKAIPGMAHPIFQGIDLFDKAALKPVNDVSRADGNFVTSAYGLYSFFDRLLRKQNVLQPGSLKQMLDGDFQNGRTYGCGIFSKMTGGTELIYHTGRQVSYIATCVYAPEEDKIVVVLTNNMDDEYGDLVVNELLGVKFY